MFVFWLYLYNTYNFVFCFNVIIYKAATSSLNEMQEGTYFKPVIGDTVPAASVEKVVFCSGKHFYELEKERNRLKVQNLAIIRLEVCNVIFHL